MFRDAMLVYKDAWKTCNRRNTSCRTGAGNAVDKFFLKVVQNNETVGHLPCEYSQILWLLQWKKNYCKRLCVGMEIPCWLMFSCSSKVKINRLKELLESKIRQ